MYEYFCSDCDVQELSCEVEVKKKCPSCGVLMLHNEWEE